jgi:hypothetical protein
MHPPDYSEMEERGFIHPTNKRHTTQMLHDLLGRLAITDRDQQAASGHVFPRRAELLTPQYFPKSSLNLAVY